MSGSVVVYLPLSDDSTENKYDLLVQRYEREKKEWDLERKKMENLTQAKRLTQLEQQLHMREARWQQHHNENCVYLAKLQTSLVAEKQQVKQLQLRLCEQESIINKQEQKVASLTQQVKCLGKQKKFLRTTLARLQLDNCTGKENSETLWLDLAFHRKNSSLNPDPNTATGLVSEETPTSGTVEMAPSSEDNNHIIEENKKLRKTNEEFSSRIKKLTISNARLKIHNRTCGRQSEDSTVIREVDELRQNLDVQREAVATLGKENQDLVRTSAELQLSLTRLETDCDHLRQELRKKKAKISILKHKNTGKFELRVIERKLTEKTAEVSELTQENERLRIHTEKSTEVISRLIEENSAMIRAEQFQKKLRLNVDKKTEALVALMNEKEFLCAELHAKTENLEKVFLEKNALLFRLERLEAKLRVGMGEECNPGDSTKTENLKIENPTEKQNSKNPKAENLKIENPTEKQNSENPKTENLKIENQKEGKTKKPKTEKTHSEERPIGKSGRNFPRNKDNTLKPPEKLLIPFKTLEQTSGWAREWSSFLWEVVSGRV